MSQTEQEYFLDVTAAVGDLSEWITHDNQSIKFYKALNELQGREKRQFIKQYSQSYMNGEIDNTDVWGYLINETSPIFVRNFFYKCNVCRTKIRITTTNADRRHSWWFRCWRWNNW